MVDILAICCDYFESADASALKKKMESYNIHQLKLNREAFLTPISKSSKQAIEILQALNISNWNEYLNSGSVYEFLEKLSREGIDQANTLLHIIDDKRAIGKLQLILGTLLAAVFIAMLLLSPSMSGVLTWIQSFLGSAISIPVLSLSYTGSVVLYSAYQNQFDPRRKLTARIIDNFFLLSGGALNVAGYVLLIGSAAVMSPLIGVLFVAASGIEVVKSVFILTRNYLNYNSNSRSPPLNSLADQQAAVRYELNYIQNRNTLLINITSAMFLVGLMAIWSFLPGGIIVTAAVLLGMGIVYAVKALANKHNEQNIREKLQKELHQLKNNPKPSELIELVEREHLQPLNNNKEKIGQGMPEKNPDTSLASQTSAGKPPPTVQQTNFSANVYTNFNQTFFKPADVKPTPSARQPQPSQENPASIKLETDITSKSFPVEKTLEDERSGIPSASGNK